MQNQWHCSICHQGEAEEVLVRSEHSLHVVCTAQEQLFNARLAVDLSTNIFAYIGSIASYLIIAIPIFGGFYEEMTPGELAKLVSNNAFVCMMLIYQLSQLVTMTGTVAGMVGSTYRVTEMLDRLQWMPGMPEKMPEPAQPDVLLSMQTTDIVSPGSANVLIKGLSLEVSRGQDLLVMGPSGAGKTSLLRVLRGLWPGGQGVVAMVGGDQLACLPQREFLGQGSLRELLTPGQKGQGGYQDETTLIELVTLVGLDGLLSRCGGLDGRLDQAWGQILSPGERQRLLWARILHQRPSLALLDEATSAVSEEVQTALYEAAQARGIGLISVGHRNSLRHLHSHLLQLDGSGGWSLGSLRKEETTPESPAL